MKKIISILLSLVFCMSFPFSASASDTNNTSSVAAVDPSFYLEADYYVEDGIVYLKRDKVLFSNGEITTHQLDTVALIPTEGKSSTDVINSLNSYKNKAKTRASYLDSPTWDSSVSVQHNCSFNYVSKMVGDFTYIKLTSFSGNYTLHDNHVRVAHLFVEYGNTGPGDGRYYTQNAEQTITTSNWSYSAPSNWEYVIIDAGAYYVGTTYNYTIQHMGGSTWYMTVQHNYNG